jgi:hypothetical protein
MTAIIASLPVPGARRRPRRTGQCRSAPSLRVHGAHIGLPVGQRIDDARFLASQRCLSREPLALGRAERQIEQQIDS